MKNTRAIILRSTTLRSLQIICAVVFFTTVSFRVFAAGDNWKPVDPAELALKTPVVEKDADAEAIFWEVRVLDEVDGGIPHTVLNHYIRIKIFTDRGRESQTRIDIPFLNNTRIKDIAARTVKPDGTIIELKKEDVFERDIVRLNKRKIKAKSFAMPGIEPGAIIEYRWKEIRSDDLVSYERFEFSRDIPVQTVKYYIKPLSLPNFPYGMRAQMFHTSNTPFSKEKDGYNGMTVTNVPAFREEPHMPPEYSVRPWMLVYYTEDNKAEPSKYWKDFGKKIYGEYKGSMKINDDVRQTAASITAGAATADEKLRKLHEFCRAKIKNANSATSGLSREERVSFKESKNPAETLKRGIGTGKDISLLFAALATAAGFEARVVRLSDRSDIFFDQLFADSYFLRVYDIAVRENENDKWRVIDPGSRYVPYGMLLWQEEGNQALVSDPKEPVFIQTPLSPPEKTRKKRTANLKLSEDGTLEGVVRVEYTGHFSIEKKYENEAESPSQREETLKNSVRAQMSTAELSDIRIENVTDPDKPFAYQYHVRVPGFAERTGKRLFLQPSFFQRGVAPLFPNSQRKYNVYFHFPWSEEDSVEIELPAGFALDNADAPAPFKVGDVVSYSVRMGITEDGHTLIYKRNFLFKGILVAVQNYTAVKQIFDVLHKADNHTITLKLKSAAATTTNADSSSTKKN
ncbi:MAG: hypothetical protein NVSMB56_07830 [Pyrinomonadaceae bacterium]